MLDFERLPAVHRIPAGIPGMLRGADLFGQP